MLEHFPQGTWVPCRCCGRKIFITEADVTSSGGLRLVWVRCDHPCSDFGQLFGYDEIAFQIPGTFHNSVLYESH